MNEQIQWLINEVLSLQAEVEELKIKVEKLETDNEL